MAVPGLPSKIYFSAISRVSDLLGRPVDLVDLDDSTPLVRHLRGASSCRMRLRSRFNQASISTTKAPLPESSRRQMSVPCCIPFYKEIKKIFKLIAREWDGEAPSSDSWRRDLLNQMSETAAKVLAR